jgi:hypothetical protein
MITGMFGAEAGWSVSLDFSPAGLCCAMQFWPRDGGSGEPKALTDPGRA